MISTLSDSLCFILLCWSQTLTVSCIVTLSVSSCWRSKVRTQHQLQGPTSCISPIGLVTAPIFSFVFPTSQRYRVICCHSSCSSSQSRGMQLLIDRFTDIGALHLIFWFRFALSFSALRDTIRSPPIIPQYVWENGRQNGFQHVSNFDYTIHIT